MNEPELLFVSDDPERFTQHGRLFHAPLPNDGSTIRFLFDHVNGAPGQMRVMAGIHNGGAAAANVEMLGGSAGPSANGMDVGHQATLRFIQAHEDTAPGPSSQVIASNSTLAIVDVVLKPRDCVAGIFELSCDAGSACELRVIACDPANDQMDVFDALPEAPNDGRDRRGIFDMSGMSDPVDLAYSGAAISDQIGARTLPRAAGDPYGGVDYLGEYGVLRSFNVSAQSDAYLYQSARGGSATATYFIDGSLWASHQIPARARSKICSIGAGQSFLLVTMAEINSSYPLDITADQNDATVADAGQPGSPLYEA